MIWSQDSIFGDVYIYDNFLSTFSTNIIKNLFFITDNMINQIIFDFNFFIKLNI